MLPVPALLAATVGPVVGLLGTVYAVRKLREWQWGWIRRPYSLEGRVYIVTGANTGLGFETAKALAARNATVIMACRSANRANAAISKIRQTTANGHLVFMALDLSDLTSVRRFAAELLAAYPRFECLINNAGLGLKTHQTNDDGLELTFVTNHLGHFLLTQLLDDAISTNNSRIVIVSSTLHKRGQIDFERLGKGVEVSADGSSNRRRSRNPNYEDSKLANFYMARELYKRGRNVHVLCPGLCGTDFFRDYNPRWYHYVMFAPVVWLMLRSAEQGAQNIIYCATDNENTETQNPATGYYVRSLRQDKSGHPFDDDVGKRLWLESDRLCADSVATSAAEASDDEMVMIPQAD